MSLYDRQKKKYESKSKRSTKSELDQRPRLHRPYNSIPKKRSKDITSIFHTFGVEKCTNDDLLDD